MESTAEKDNFSTNFHTSVWFRKNDGDGFTLHGMMNTKNVLEECPVNVVGSQECSVSGSGNGLICQAVTRENEATMSDHTNKPFICGYCQMRFTKKGLLKIHERRHTGERPFQCPMCSKSFTRKDTLVIHIRVHTGEKPFSCDRCQKTFSRSDKLSLHHRTHTAKLPYKCIQCDEVFRYKSSLKRHMIDPTGIKPFKCDSCEKTFVRRDLFISHMLNHTVEGPFACPVCGKRYICKSYLTSNLHSPPEFRLYECANTENTNVGQSNGVDSNDDDVENDQKHNPSSTEVAATGKHFLPETACHSTNVYKPVSTEAIGTQPAATEKRLSSQAAVQSVSVKLPESVIESEYLQYK